MFHWLLKCFPHGHSRRSKSHRKGSLPPRCISHSHRRTSKTHVKNPFALGCSGACIVRDGNISVETFEGVPTPSPELVTSLASHEQPPPPNTFDTWREWIMPMSTIWEEVESRLQSRSQTPAEHGTEGRDSSSLRKAVKELESQFPSMSDVSEAKAEEDIWVQVGNECADSTISGVMLETGYAISWITERVDEPIVKSGVRKLVQSDKGRMIPGDVQDVGVM